MRPAAGLEEFRRRPEGLYLAAEHSLYLCESPELYALFLWGRPGAEETRRLVESLAVEMRPDVKLHRTLVDFSGLTGIDSESFGVLRDFLESVKKRQAEVTERESVIRPGGFAGTIVAGFFVLFPQLYPTRLFTETAPALEWLGVPPEQGRAWHELLRQVRDGSPELAQLRGVLAGDLSVDLPRVAKHLGLSARTLQRKLKDLGTSFQAELDRARLEIAERMLAEGDEKLSAIGVQVGFASYPHFSQWFHRQTGVTAEARRQSAKRL